MDFLAPTAAILCIRNNTDQMTRFRWAFCQLESIKTCRNTRDVHDKLNSLPKDLDETYLRMLEAIPRDDRETAITALQWLAFSNRPLYISELAEASVMDPAQDPPFDGENRFQDPLHILRIVSDLVSVDDQNGMVSFGHFTIKEYLLSNRLPESVREFGIRPHLGHKFLLKSCLQYNCYVLDRLERNIFPHADYPLLSYSRVEWSKHTSKCVLDTECNELIYKILCSRARYLLWGWRLPDAGFGLILAFSECPLFIAVFLNLYDVCSMMLAKGADPNEFPNNRYFDNCTLIEQASLNGNEAIASLLIDAGCNVNLGVDDVGQPCISKALHLAVCAGKAGLVQLLMDAGADTASFNNRVLIDGDFTSDSPLQMAAARNRWDIFKILLGCSRDMDGNYGYAFRVIADTQNCEVLADLKEQGSVANAVKWALIEDSRKPKSWWSLTEPSVRKKVRAALELGFDTNGCDRNAKTAFQRVAALDPIKHARKIKLMKLLLEYGADPNIHYGGDLIPPLQIILLKEWNFHSSWVSTNMLSFLFGRS